MTYSREDVERLLPCLWDDEKWINGIPNELAPDHDMPKGPPPNPSHAGGHWVAVADMRRAWEAADLNRKHRQVLVARFGLDLYLEEIGTALGISFQAAGTRLDRAVNRIGTFLNGRPFPEREDASPWQTRSS